MNLDEIRLRAVHPAREMTVDEEMLNDFLATLTGSGFTFFASTNDADEFIEVTVYEMGCLIVRVLRAEAC